MKKDLPESEKKILLSAARRAITTEAEGQIFEPQTDDVPPGLLDRRGVFVSLHKDGKLRGCIGFPGAVKQLYDAVISASLSAAFKDPRFSPVTCDELDQIEIEISVLTPPAPVDSWEDIKLGTHGVILRKRGLQALFLPQVAVEQKWDLAATLSHLSVKAGFKENDWRKDTEFEVFEAIVFKEGEINI
ncbi:MAG TPA: AmmeMemoRadiSam system protein A [Nitrospirae bacterium]|nr:AmmeMemoRadiSam system protein A [Nitrospirota bacterium]